MCERAERAARRQSDVAIRLFFARFIAYPICISQPFRYYRLPIINDGAGLLCSEPHADL